MNNMNSKSSRRTFFLQGGAVLGAGAASVAASASTAGTQSLNEDLGTLQQQLAAAQDREAIRQLHLAFTSQVEDHPHELDGGEQVILQVRANHLQNRDTMLLSEDRLRATATWHVDAAVGMPLLGNSTVEKMARLQGQFAGHRWESGRIEAKYVKSEGQWKIATLAYLTA
jgi:hypothetical protein